MPAVSRRPYADLVKELKAQTDRLTGIESHDLAAFNPQAIRLGLEAVR